MKSDSSKTTGETLSGVAVMAFENASEWEGWLARNHSGSGGIFLKIAKRGAPTDSVTYAEALEVALCYGWIDAQKKPYDDHYWLQKFTLRKRQSIWSKINREKALDLIARGKMKPAGLAAIEAAKQGGRWDGAYDSPGRAEVPEDLRAELDRNAKAREFFATLRSTNRYAILYRLQTAKKPETRARRLAEYVRMLENHETIHPQ